MALDSSQYDSLVSRYEKSLALPSRRCDTANLFANVGDVRGRTVLDLSTGTGYIARTLAKMGAATVVGVDINEAMLGKAREILATDPSVPQEARDAVTYEAGDVFSPLELVGGAAGEFDLVTGVWSLNYAGNQAMLDQAFCNVAKYLKSGGRFVTIIPAHDVHGNWPLQDEAPWYGVMASNLRPIEHGYKVAITFVTDDPVQFDTYDLPSEFFTGAAAAAGLTDVQIDGKRKVAPPLKAGEDQAYWDRYLERPVFDVLTAVKP